MNNTRWILGWNGNYELHDYSHKIDTVLMEITEESQGKYYLICPEMEYDGFDANYLLLDSMTIKDAKAEAEGIYEEWLKEQIYHYNHRLNLLFGKTA